MSTAVGEVFLKADVERMPMTNGPRALPPPQHYAVGSIVTLRMRGHTRTQGQEYYAPAVVLDQHPATSQGGGEIEVIVWDSTAGTHYNPSYAVREVSSRPGLGGVGTELFELQSNIGEVLFSPETFAQMCSGLAEAQAQILDLDHEFTKRWVEFSKRLAALEQAVTAPQPGAGGPVQPPVASAPKTK
jgi:hypothetical protein